MEEPVWRQGVGGTLVAEMARFTLIVRSEADGVRARFMVMARPLAGADILIGSGTTGGIAEAMRSAERIVRRQPDGVGPMRLHVIVVDDDETVRGAIADALRDGNYQVAEVASAEGALQHLEHVDRPVIMISDINLGAGMTGLQLAAIVRQLRPEAGVLLMSGDEEPLAGNPQGDGILGHEILAKPFSTDRLLGRVARIALRLTASGMATLN